MSRTKTILVALPLALVAVTLFFGFRIHAEMAAGQQVFWLAELWPPAAVITIIVVVCIDLLVPPAAPVGRSKKKGRPAA